MSTIPDPEGCVRILREAGCSQRVVKHSCTVHALAMPIAEKCGADLPLVSAGALLHDLGRAVEQGATHAIVGANMARELGLSEKLVEIIRRHVGAGLDDEDVRNLDLPPGDYMPRTLEEKIVAHADNLTTDDRLWSYQKAQTRMVAKGLFRPADRLKRLHEELSKLFGSDLDLLVFSMGEKPALHPACGE